MMNCLGNRTLATSTLRSRYTPREQCSKERHSSDDRWQRTRRERPSPGRTAQESSSQIGANGRSPVPPSVAAIVEVTAPKTGVGRFRAVREYLQLFETCAARA